jgi:hypothetical protein
MEAEIICMSSADDSRGNESQVSDRSRWPVRKGRLCDLEVDEPDLSTTTTAEERMAIMWQLAKDAWAFRGEPNCEPGLSRHSGRIIRRGS